MPTYFFCVYTIPATRYSSLQDTMNVVIQHTETKLYLTQDGSWVKLDAKPVEFANAVEAISFCIQRGLRSIRLVNNPGSADLERYLYPFGADPAIKAERKKLRKSLTESRRLKQQRRTLMAHLDMIEAEAKERRKQVPFKRKPVSEE
jgi:hypothetical protein